MDNRNSSVRFIPLACPNCSGELMINESQDKAICSYCGKPFLVRDALQEISQNVENLISLGETALETRNNEEAYSYFSQALEINPEDYRAWVGKAKATGWLSTSDNPRVDEAKIYFNQAFKYCPTQIKDELSQQLKDELILLYGILAWMYHQIFLEMINEIREDINSYNHFQAQLGRDWRILVDNCKFAFTNIESETKDFREINRCEDMLQKLIGLCDYLIKGVPWQYRLEYEGPVEKWIPTMYLSLNSKDEAYIRHFRDIVIDTLKVV